MKEVINLKKIKDILKFIKNADKSLCQIIQYLNQVKPLNINSLDPSETALIVVDMVKGFTSVGPLKSPRIEALIPQIAKIMRKCIEKNISIVFLDDAHSKNCPEFEYFPPHCIKGTEQSEVVDELKRINNYIYIPKNSTDGFLEPKFQCWLKNNCQIKTFIVVGDCTDICVLQFILTLKANFNRINKQSRIIIPWNAVDTYNTAFHNADLMNVFALYNLKLNGSEIVERIIG